jgi:serine/threonine protein kinase
MMGNIILDRDEIASVFEASDLDFDLYLDMLEENHNRKKNRFVQKLIKIMSSWIAPIVALIFVVSFEMGRRERLKAEKISTETEKGSDETNGTAINNGINTGVIQLTDEILGYGGHGTIVYRGVLDKRQVAVKRLLSMYHTSADREISLLIESDGHPNVVRYFLKEIRGDFVYLALELCDMSLNDLIVSLSKLKNARKSNFQLSGNDDFESATKSLLFQIASGVRHIHSLRM